MTDINAIKARLRDAYCGSGDYDAALSEASNDVAALCDEVERLRGENSRLRDVLGWVETQCPGKCAGVCFDALSGEHRREGDT